MPAKFRFGLQPLLELRRRIEEEQRQSYAARRREIDDNAREVRRLTTELRAALTGEFSVAQLACVDAAINARRCRSGALEADLAQAQAALVVASRDRRVIEKLLERRRRAFEAQRARREEEEIEEANRRTHPLVSSFDSAPPRLRSG